MYKDYRNFENRLKQLHLMENKILELYNITPAKNGMECFHCGAEKMGFFIDNKTSHYKCKCWSCGFQGDVLDIIKKIDFRFTKKKNKDILDFVLGDKFFTIKPPYLYSYIPSEKQELDINTTVIENNNSRNYINFYEI